MLIDRLKEQYLEELHLEIKFDYPTTYEYIEKCLKNTEYVSDIPYGIFMLMREHFGEKYSAYDYFI